MKLDAAEMTAVDNLVDHLCAEVDKYTMVGDPLRDRYVGFCAVTVATHLETLLKSVILDFCKKQNLYLHSMVEQDLKRLNGRIGYQDLRKFLKRFDGSIDDRFVKLVTRLNSMRVVSVPGVPDLVVSYGSLLSIRHSFVHNLNASFAHVTTADLRGYVDACKRVASAFARSLP